MVGLSHYLILGALLFAISVIGIFLNRKNVIILLMATLPVKYSYFLY
jgi:NADH-quinone oxidoreductase subunit K